MAMTNFDRLNLMNAMQANCVNNSFFFVNGRSCSLPYFNSNYMKSQTSTERVEQRMCGDVELLMQQPDAPDGPGSQLQCVSANDESCNWPIKHTEDSRRQASNFQAGPDQRNCSTSCVDKAFGAGGQRVSSQSSASTDCFTLSTSDESKSNCTKSQKRKGGWPKGRKRKDGSQDAEVPKAPTTGYVMFLTERRRFYKETCPDVPFAEVTKLLGSEWTNLPRQEKQKYLDRAEADKKRYRQELRLYRLSDSYRNATSKKMRSECFLTNGSQANFEDDISADLYCDVCDQFFSSLHNKKEHLYGRQHLQAVTGESARGAPECRKYSSEDTAGIVLDSRDCKCASERHSGGATNVNQAIEDFIKMTIDRNLEVKQLRCTLRTAMTRNSSLLNELRNVQILDNQLRDTLRKLSALGTRLGEQLESLRMVPTLFGAINFQHQT